MAAIITASAIPMPAFAASIGSNSTDTSVGADTKQNAQTQYTEIAESDTQTQVYLSVDESDLIASLPTTIILSGTPSETGQYIGKYSVGVQGEMAGDKVINIEPESTTVTLHQKGKLESEATISQEQTTFDTDDFKAKTTTTGTVTAERLSAGSWNSDFNFNIRTDKINSFYSSLSLAVDDINNNSVGTKDTSADLFTVENAVCSVYKENDDVYRIEIYKDIDNQAAVTINKNVKIDFNDHIINFATGGGFVLNADSTFYDGAINTVNSISIKSNNAASSFTSKDMNINATSTDDYNNILGCVVNNTLGDTLLNTNLNSINKANNKYSIGYYSNNKNSMVKIDNCSIDVSANNGLALCAQVANSNMNNTKITGYSTSGVTGEAQGIAYQNGKSHILKNVTINAKVPDSPTKSNTKSTSGIIVRSGTVDIYNCNIECYGNVKNTSSNGISIKKDTTVNLYSGVIKINSDTLTGVDCTNRGITAEGTLNINETNGRVFIKGGNCAIGTLYNDTTAIININGGTYCSPNHGGLYNGDSKSIDINNALFYNSKTAGEDQDATCVAYGGMYSEGIGTITVSNSKIIGGSHGIRIKNTSGAANVTVNNTYIEGQNDALSLAAGTFTVGKNVTVKSKSGKLLEDNPQGTLVDPNGVFSK